MGDNSAISWTDATWNPVRGCSRVSPGCGGPGDGGGCYAEIMAARFSGPGMWGEGFAHMVGGDHRWTGKVEMIDHMLNLPLRWRRPRKIFVNSTSDLFHEKLPNEAIDRVFAVMALAPQHTFQILTKRAERMHNYIKRLSRQDSYGSLPRNIIATAERHGISYEGTMAFWPLRNIWLGVSVEDQERADERIPALLATPAAVRFISAEPLLEAVDFSAFLQGSTLNLIIVGGESGAGARPFDIDWARQILRQCRMADVACFIKQLGSHPIQQNLEYVEGQAVEVSSRDVPLRDKKGADPAEWPEDLRVQQFPKVKP